MNVLTKILALSCLALSFNAFSATQELARCEQLIDKKGKIESINLGYNSNSPSEIYFTMSLSENNKSISSKVIGMSRWGKTKAGTNVLNVLISALDNNYIVVIKRCNSEKVAAFNIEANSMIITKESFKYVQPR